MEDGGYPPRLEGGCLPPSLVLAGLIAFGLFCLWVSIP